MLSFFKVAALILDSKNKEAVTDNATFFAFGPEKCGRSGARMAPEQLAERQRLEALAEMMKSSLIVLSCLPMMIAYPFVQKHLVKGVMLGAIKG